MSDIHNAIMNIPCKAEFNSRIENVCYKLGHRDARHAAAELAAELDAENERLSGLIEKWKDAFYREERRANELARSATSP